MFKKISVFLVLVLVITTLSACASGVTGANELSDSKKEEIVQAWTKKLYPLNWNAKAGEPCSIQYMGSFDSFEVFQWYQPDSQDGAEGKRIIDGVDFYGNYKTDFLVLVSNEFEYLGNLRVYKRISHNAIVAIAQAQADGISLPISKTLKKNIEDAWLTRSSWKWSKDGGNGCRYYGKYDGYDMIFFQGEFPLESITGYEVAGEKFICGSFFQLLAYRNGEFYELEQLYEGGKVSKEAITKMSESHKEWFPVHYSDAAF